MQITTGTTVNGRRFDMTLTDDDGILALGAEKWQDLSLLDRYKKLAQAADLMVVDYLFRENLIDDDMARTRMAEIRARA